MLTTSQPLIPRSERPFAVFFLLVSSLMLTGAIDRRVDTGWIALLIGVSVVGLSLVWAYRIATIGRITLWLALFLSILTWGILADDARRAVNHTLNDDWFGAFGRDIVLILISMRAFILYFKQRKSLEIEPRTD